MVNMHYYRILEVDPGASPGEVKAAYRRLVKKYHPDLSGLQTSGVKLREVINAYKHVLGAPTLEVRETPSYSSKVKKTHTSRNSARISLYQRQFNKVKKYGSLLLHSTDPAVRINAAISLGELKMISAYSWLRMAFWDNNPRIVEAVIKAVGALGVLQCDREMATLYLKGSSRLKQIIIKSLSIHRDLKDFPTIYWLTRQG